ncbi:MAG: iron-containing alcohol dehydrogenase [Bacillota bacterium]|nr:iron-containing alcohol dehydrogenase [Bacillota bacterium]
MLDFNFQSPTKILFGRNKILKLGNEIKKIGDKILLVYGGGSIKRSGLYDQVISILQDHEISYQELSGVQANPRIESVRKGVALCQEHNLQMVLAVGGGSVIDCSKAIAAGTFYEGDPWDFFIRRASVKKALPVASILTLAATGSEMNGNAVISNESTQEKLGTGSPVLTPRFSILDPQYTFSVPANQTAAGTADIMSHVFEQYFSSTSAFLQDRMAEGVLKTCIEMGPIAVADPDNYEARANLMWAGSVALNGLLGTGKAQDWATHGIEHELSALYDMTHGLGLAILTPVWMEYVLSEETLMKFCEYANNVWDINESDDFATARGGIQKTAEFFQSLGLASRLRDVGVAESSLEIMASKATARGYLGSFKSLDKEDVLRILQQAY